MIGRANLNGTGVDQSFMPAGAERPAGIAVDALTGSCAGDEAPIVGTGRPDKLKGRTATT